MTQPALTLQIRCRYATRGHLSPSVQARILRGRSNPANSNNV